MTLQRRVTLIDLASVIAAVVLCSLMLLSQSRQNAIDLAVRNALAYQSVREDAWENAVEDQLDKQYSDTAQRSLARYLFDRLAGENAILLAGSDTIYNCTSTDPALYLPLETREQQHSIVRQGGRQILITGSRAEIGRKTYHIYRIRHQ